MKKYIVIILVMLIVSISVILFMKNKSDVLLDEVELKDNVYAGVTFAIMIEDENGDYEEYGSLSWPTGMVYNASLSGCIDNQGKEISDALSYSDGVAIAQTGSTSFCYLFFNIADIEVESIVNGVGDKAPTTGAYTVTTTTGSYWSEKYRTLNITSASSNTNSKYSLQFTTDSSTKINLRDYIVNLLDGETSVTSGNGYLADEGYVYYGDYTNATDLTEENYGSVTQFSSSSATSTSGTEVSVWSYADSMWTSDSESMTSGTYYHLSTTVNTSGYYQMCYSMTDGYDLNYLYVYVNETAQYIGSSTYIAASKASSKSGCVDLGYIESGDTVKFTQSAYSYGPYTIASMSVSLELGTTTSESAGIRYEGANPNNYVWFNDEMWRIIGVIPTVVDKNGTTENLVKIIRSDSIGAYAYDGQNGGYTGVWGLNTLYTLLNSYYWGASDGTGTSYCMGYSTYALPNCDYTNIGISSTGYYGSMVQYVYWNTGASNYAVTPATVYANETAIQTVGGYIGIMNASDYGYAYYSTDHSTIMNSYNSTSITSSDWLYKTGVTWTMTVNTTSTYALSVYLGGRVTGSGASVGFGVRPVLYLKSADVYIADGTGSESDPYILGVE